MLKCIRGDIVKENKLIDLSMDFSVTVLNAVETIKGHSALVNQIERSSTSIGANIHEANYAQSKSDFISKLQIALKESYETEYWLELFQKAGFLNEVTTKALLNQCGTIRRLLIASVNTAKNNK
ncbi:MAG: four helix bundle protein [Eubacterium sp.]|nr:four helix bundle protein [Eubacterium sp.]